jgi:hypothetical protein
VPGKAPLDWNIPFSSAAGRQLAAEILTLDDVACQAGLDHLNREYGPELSLPEFRARLRFLLDEPPAGARTH